MQPQTNQESSPQPLPDHLQERIWAFVRQKIRQHEDKNAGCKVAKYEIHFTDSGQIEVEVIAMQDGKTAAIAGGLEDSGREYTAPDDDVNRTRQREDLSEDLGNDAAAARRN